MLRPNLDSVAFPIGGPTRPNEEAADSPDCLALPSKTQVARGALWQAGTSMPLQRELQWSLEVGPTPLPRTASIELTSRGRSAPKLEVGGANFYPESDEQMATRPPALWRVARLRSFAYRVRASNTGYQLEIIALCSPGLRPTKNTGTAKMLGEKVPAAICERFSKQNKLTSLVLAQ